MKRYPEHEKLAKIKDQSQSIGEFLEWLADDQRVLFRKRHECDNHCDEDCDSDGCEVPYWTRVEDLLAVYFEIDPKKLSIEKDEMLAEIRKGVI